MPINRNEGWSQWQTNAGDEKLGATWICWSMRQDTTTPTVAVPFDCSTMTLRPSMAMVAGRNGFVALDESHSCCAVRRCVRVGKCNLQYKAMSNRKHVGKILAGRLRAATMPIKYEKCQDQCAKPHLRWQ